MSSTGRRFEKRGKRWLLWPIVVALLLAATCDTALARGGDLDRSFGRNGRALVPVGTRNQPSGSLEAQSWLNGEVATATMSGGRLVAAGERTLVALRRDGTVDREFGSNGRVNLPVIGEGETFVKDVAVDSEGRIVVLAAARFARGGGLAIIARLSASGRFDASFADNGILLTDFGLPAPQPWGPSAPHGAPTDVLPLSLAIDDQGRTVIGGTTLAAFAPCRSAGEQPQHAVFLARMLPTGDLDPGFGNGGVMLDERNPFYVEQHPFFRGLGIRKGAIFYATTDGSDCEGSGNGLLVRLDEAGARDPSFGSAGLAEVTPVESLPLGIAVDRRGRVVVMRQATPGETKYLASFEVLSRWNADGTLDPGFGRGGEIAVKLPGEASGFEALATDARGRTLLAGKTALPPTPAQQKRHVFPPPKFVLMRLSATGLPDHGFGKKGLVSTGFGRQSRAVATDIAIRGKTATLAGPLLSDRIHPRHGFAVARYLLDR